MDLESESEFEAAASESSLSTAEETASEATATDSEDYAPSRRRRGGGSGSGKQGKKGRGGRSDELDLEGMDEETKFMTLQKLKEKRKADKAIFEDEMAPVRRQEAKMKKELGRKLTNGEKNIIRLVLVS